LAWPNASLRRKEEATLAAWTTFLLGRQAMFGQGPPTYLRPTTATFFPWEARVQARYLPASPLPGTTTSYSSAIASVTF
jgi:hypothetical protein